MTNRELCDELNELRSKYSMFDDSDENRRIGQRILEIRKELGTIVEPRKSRRRPIYKSR